MATLIGFGVGLLLVGVVLVGPNVIKNLPAISLPKFSLPKISLPQTPKKISITPSPTPLSKPLTIDSPLSETIEVKAETLVSGATYPNAVVVIAGEESETVVIANTGGKYAGKVSLLEGKNEIIVVSHTNGATYSQSVTVFYTPEEL